MAVTEEDTTSAAADIATGGAAALLGKVVGKAKSQWEGSKGEEVLAGVSSSVSQETKDYLSNAKSKLFNPAYLRSPKVFFGIGEERAFFFEKGPQLLMERLKHNVTYFYLNYFIITAVIFILTLLTSRAVIGFVCLALAWASFFKATASGSLSIGRFEISQKNATMGMSVLSAFALFYLLSNVFWWTLSSSGFFVALHAFFRDASMHKDEEDQVEMSGDLSLEENASFLNPVENEAV